MKLLILVLLVLMVLIPFSIEAKDYDYRKCCSQCAEWVENKNGFVRCLKWEIVCPCPHGQPAFGGHNDIILAGHISKPEGFSVWKAGQWTGDNFYVRRMGIIPEDIIKEIPERHKQTFLDLMSKYFWVLALFPALWIVKQIFVRWR